MPTILPAVRKTWQFVKTVISGLPDAVSVHRAMLYEAKQALKSAPLSPAVVMGSADGTTGAMDGQDRWTHSQSPVLGAWVVMRFPGLGNIQVLWQHGTAGGSPWTLGMWVSPAAGFTGGGPTTRPTAADEINIPTGNFNLVATTATVHLNVAVSTDGKANRLWAFQSGAAIWFSLWDLIHNAPAQLTSPWICFYHGLTNVFGVGPASYEHIREIGGFKRGSQGATTLSYSLLGHAHNDGSANIYAGQNANINNSVNQLSTDYALAPLAVACETASNRGVMGELVDLWCSPTNAVNGDTYPEAAYVGAGGLDQFVQVGDLVLPWDGTVPVTGGAASTRRQGRVVYASQALVEEPEDEPVSVIPPVTFTPQLSTTSAVDFGTDFDVLDNFPKSFVLASGFRNLAQALARALLTPKGFFALAFDGDPDYGYDLRSMLNAATTPAGIGAIESKVRAACERDERVRQAEVTASFEIVTQTLTVEIIVDTDAGPFRLVLHVSALTTEIVLGEA